MGALLLSYLLEHALKRGEDMKSLVVYDTIVTGGLGRTIAQAYGVRVESTLTGFKYIGKKIAALEQQLEPRERFFFGYEESYGFLLAPFCRDKDALQASLMIAEMALSWSQQGITLKQKLTLLQRQYGYHYEEVCSVSLPGLDGQAQLHRMMQNLRAATFLTLGGFEVCRREDYLSLRFSTRDGAEGALSYPPSDVLRYELSDGSVLAIRPSGTEPKCKVYYNLVGRSAAATRVKLERIAQDLAVWLQ